MTPDAATLAKRADGAAPTTGVVRWMARWRQLSSVEREAVRRREQYGALLSRIGANRGPGAPNYTPGYWLIQLVKNGPMVPASITRVHTTREPACPENDMTDSRSPFLAAFILGEPAKLDDVWFRKGSYVIDETEYRFRLADAEWARDHAPADPAANPRQRIDPLQSPIVF